MGAHGYDAHVLPPDDGDDWLGLTGDALNVVVSEDTALANRDAVRRNARRQALSRLKCNLEGAQVAIIDADQPTIQFQRPLEFVVIVDLDDCIHAKVFGASGKVPRDLITNLRHDDQDAVSAPQPCFSDLIGIEHEILAQSGKAGSSAGICQKFRSALEGWRIGQDRQASGPTLFICLGQGRRIEVFPDQPFRRACLLDLGNQRIITGCQAGIDSTSKTTDRGYVIEAPAQLRQRQPSLGRLDFGQLVGRDSV